MKISYCKKALRIGTMESFEYRQARSKTTIVRISYYMILQALSLVIFISGSFISVANFITLKNKDHFTRQKLIVMKIDLKSVPGIFSRFSFDFSLTSLTFDFCERSKPARRSSFHLSLKIQLFSTMFIYYFRINKLKRH